MLYQFGFLVFVLALASRTAAEPLSSLNDSEKCLPGGEFTMGSDRHYAEERAERRVSVNAFCIDRYEVTNKQFAEFVTATDYVTIAESGPSKADYPNAPAAFFEPGSAVFEIPEPSSRATNLSWWRFVDDAQWRRPVGSGSSVAELDDHPVVQLAYKDALAYARWRGRDLPTEAEWEYAARGGGSDTEFAWGDERAPGGVEQANTWQGEFPVENKATDGHRQTSPVGSFPANDFGLFDMIGNVWEWTKTDFSADTVSTDTRRAIKGGSYLCAPNYCARYRPAARQAQETGLGTNHIGFRTVRRAQRE